MMDTVLNLGLNDRTVEGLAAASGDARFAYDSYRRFIQMYADVVLEVDHYLFEEALEDAKQARGVPLRHRPRRGGAGRAGRQLQDHRARRPPASRSRRTPRSSSGAPSVPCSAPGRPRGRSPTAGCTTSPGDMGTAVTVQAMVFGNMGDDCATGVAFTRNPSTGERAFYGEFLINAQGEDVVAGIRTPQPLTRVMAAGSGSDGQPMEEVLPRGVRRARGRVRPARGALPRDAGHRVHHPARQALHPADPHREADRAGGAQDRRRHGGRRADHPGRGGAARRSGLARPAAPSRRSTPRPSARSSPRACRPRRVRSRARSCSAPTTPSGWRPPARR